LKKNKDKKPRETSVTIARETEKGVSIIVAVSSPQIRRGIALMEALKKISEED
jgi:hypothetical protein